MPSGWCFYMYKAPPTPTCTSPPTLHSLMHPIEKFYPVPWREGRRSSGEEKQGRRERRKGEEGREGMRKREGEGVK